MEVEEAIKRRHSVRKFVIGKIIRSEDMNKILNAGELAPYASGGPRREFYGVSNFKIKNQIMKACFNQPYVGKCSAIIVICGTDTQTKLQSGFQKFVHDCDAAAMNMIIQATALGIGSCWIGHFQPKVVKKIAGITSRPTVILLLGYEDIENG